MVVGVTMWQVRDLGQACTDIEHRVFRVTMQSSLLLRLLPTEFRSGYVSRILQQAFCQNAKNLQMQHDE